MPPDSADHQYKSRTETRRFVQCSGAEATHDDHLVRLKEQMANSQVQNLAVGSVTLSVGNPYIPEELPMLGSFKT